MFTTFGDNNSKSGQDRPIGSAAKLLTKDEARRIAANIAKLAGAFAEAVN
jgi:hypothetical protein